MTMPRQLLTIGAAVAVITATASALAPDGQEDICNSSAVIFCDNFEARAVGQGDLTRSTFKNRGWGVSVFDGLISVANDPANAFRGSRSLQLHYPAGGGGIGYLDAALGAGYSSLYMRFYTKWASSFTWSPIATKQVSFIPASGGQDHYIFWSQWGSPTLKHYGQYIDTIFDANLNGDVTVANNRWYCFEFRFTQNSTATSTDGYLQGWVDGVQHWEYPNRNIDPRMPNSVTDFLLSGYWNCLGPTFACNQPADQHPDMYRWHDNFVLSTQRIGCLSGAPPAAPTGLRIKP